MDVPGTSFSQSTPQADFERIRPCLRSVETEQGTVLVANGGKALARLLSAQRHHFSGREDLPAGHTVETAMDRPADSVFGGLHGA